MFAVTVHEVSVAVAVSSMQKPPPNCRAKACHGRQIKEEGGGVLAFVLVMIRSVIPSIITGEATLTLVAVFSETVHEAIVKVAEPLM